MPVSGMITPWQNDRIKPSPPLWGSACSDPKVPELTQLVIEEVEECAEVAVVVVVVMVTVCSEISVLRTGETRTKLKRRAKTQTG